MHLLLLCDKRHVDPLHIFPVIFRACDNSVKERALSPLYSQVGLCKA